MKAVTPTDITPGTENAWTDVDISSYVGSDAGNVAGVLVMIRDTGFTQLWGLRKNGSSDSIYDYLGYNTKSYAWIGVDNNDIFEIYLDSITSQKLYIVGYVTNDEGVFFTNVVDKSLSTTSAWTDIDISSDTGADTATAAFFLCNHSAANYYYYGFRENGSTDDRKNNLGYNSMKGAGMSVDGNEILEGYIGSTILDFYLVGYLTSNITSFANAKAYGTATTGSYVDVDMSSDIPSGNNGAFLQFFCAASSDYDGHVRKNGASDDVYYEIDRNQYFWCEVDVNRVAEQKVESAALDLYLWGYSSEPAAGTSHTQTCSDAVTFSMSIMSDTINKKILSLSVIESMSTLSAFSLSEDETLDAVITISNDINIPLDETVQMIESLVKTIGIPFSEALAFVESISKVITFNKLFPEVLSISEELKKEQNIIITIFLNILENSSREAGSQLDISDLVAFTESISKIFGISKQEAFANIDSILTILSANRTYSEILNIEESSISLSSFARALSDILTLSELLQLSQEKLSDDSFTFIDSLQSITGTGIPLSDVLSIAVAYSKTSAKNISEVLSFVETFVKQLDTLRQDSFTITDDIIYSRSLVNSETIILDESVIKNISLSKSSSFSITEISSIVSSFARELSELLKITEDKTLIQDKIETLQDEIIIAEIIKKAISLPIASTLIIAEEMSTSLGEHEVDISETIQITDDFDKHSVYSATIIETIDLLDVLIKQYGLTKEEALAIVETHSYAKTTDVTTERLGRRTILTTNKNKTILLFSKNKTTLPMV